MTCRQQFQTVVRCESAPGTQRLLLHRISVCSRVQGAHAGTHLEHVHILRWRWLAVAGVSDAQTYRNRHGCTTTRLCSTSPGASVCQCCLSDPHLGCATNAFLSRGKHARN